jgi:hypothetical protein
MSRYQTNKEREEGKTERERGRERERERERERTDGIDGQTASVSLVTPTPPLSKRKHADFFHVKRKELTKNTSYITHFQPCIPGGWEGGRVGGWEVGRVA